MQIRQYPNSYYKSLNAQLYTLDLPDWCNLTIKGWLWPEVFYQLLFVSVTKNYIISSFLLVRKKEEKKIVSSPAGTRLWRDLALTASRTDGADVAVENLRQAALSRPLAVTHTHTEMTVIKFTSISKENRGEENNNNKKNKKNRARIFYASWRNLSIAFILNSYFFSILNSDFKRRKRGTGSIV